nr:probable RNA-binding protein 18 [Lytechinus pictus]
MNDTGGRRLWIGNLDERITEFTLLKILQKYGKIEQFDFLFHKSGPNQGKPRGYCFASFENRTDAVHALHALDGKLALGKKLAVKWAHSHIKVQKPMHLLTCDMPDFSSSLTGCAWLIIRGNGMFIFSRSLVTEKKGGKDLGKVGAKRHLQDNIQGIMKRLLSAV